MREIACSVGLRVSCLSLKRGVGLGCRGGAFARGPSGRLELVLHLGKRRGGALLLLGGLLRRLGLKG